MGISTRSRLTAEQHELGRVSALRAQPKPKSRRESIVAFKLPSRGGLPSPEYFAAAAVQTDTREDRFPTDYHVRQSGTFWSVWQSRQLFYISRGRREKKLSFLHINLIILERILFFYSIFSSFRARTQCLFKIFDNRCFFFYVIWNNLFFWREKKKFYLNLYIFVKLFCLGNSYKRCVVAAIGARFLDYIIYLPWCLTLGCEKLLLRI